MNVWAQDRIRKRSEQKIAEAIEEERQERLGPGGLDPVEVSTELPMLPEPAVSFFDLHKASE